VVYDNGVLTVGQATLTVTAANASRTYGTANPAFSASATGAVNGDTFTFTESTTATIASPVGSYSIVPLATSANLSDYAVVYDNGVLTVGQATPVISWINPASIIYGTALSSAQLNATSSVVGSLVYSPAVGAIPAAGLDTLSVTFTPTDTTDYTSATKSVQLTVAQATPVITWPTPAGIIYGTALSSTQLNASAYQANGTMPLPGNFAYSPTSGTYLSIGSQELSVTFTPTDSVDFTTATKTVSLSVTQATLTILANNFTRLYGTANPVFTGSITGVENGDTFAESFSNSAGILSQTGQYTIVPAAAGSNLSDYIQIVQNGTLSVTQAPVITTTNLSTNLIVSGLNVTMTTNVSSTTSGTPTGTVNFFDNGSPLGSVILSNGVATYSTTTLPVGTNVISTIYSGDINFTPSSASGASGVTTVTVTPLDFTLQVTSQPMLNGIYGTSGQYTLHIAPTGGSFPGDVQFTIGGNGPISSTYTFSPAMVGKNGGPTDIILTVATHKLASLETPKDLSSKLSHVAFGLFLLPLLTLRYSRRSGQKLTRILSHLALVLLSLGAISSLTGCGSGYFDHVYPITVTATSNGVQHTVTVDYHIEAAPQ